MVDDVSILHESVFYFFDFHAMYASGRAASPTDEPVEGDTRGEARILEVYGISDGDSSGSDDDSEPEQSFNEWRIESKTATAPSRTRRLRSTSMVKST